MRTFFVATSCFVAVSLLAGSVWAAPALDIRTINNGGSVFPSMAGPSGIDPQSDQGQWFRGRTGADRLEVRTHEFYDDLEEFGGGWADFFAIQGQAVNIYDSAGLPWAPGMPIAGFDILATITNDLPGNPYVSTVQGGTNSHYEVALSPMWIEEEVIMADVKLTAEFAIAPEVGPPSPDSILPYCPKDKYIVALNHNQLGWYCYADDVSPLVPPGNFSVPTWDFGDIKPGQSAQQLMSFTVTDALGNPDVLMPGDPDYLAFEEPDADLLLNRSTSLKISTWVDDLQPDWGIPYPEEPLRGSNCSVFFNPEPIPEPGMLVLLVGLGLGFWVLKRRS